jgi:hypothetical protein
MIATLICFLVAIAYADNPQYVHFWVQSPDSLVTVNNNPWSSSYGHIVSSAALPAGSTRKTSGNAPHHIGISGDKTWIVTGGLLSFFVHVPSACGGPLSGGDANGGNHDDVFLFHVGTNGIPTFHSSYNLPGGCTDEFHKLSDTQFIISQMCDDVGNSPGVLVQFNLPSNVSATATFSQWGWKASGVDFVSTDNYNPHGGDYSSIWGFVIGDFVWPTSLLNWNTRSYLDTYCGANSANYPLTFRNTVRLFGTNGILQRTYTLPGWGYQAANFIYRGYAIAAGTVPTFLGGDSTLYMIDTTCTPSSSQTCLTVGYDFSGNFGTAFSAGYFVVDKENRRILTSYGLRWLVLLQYSVNNGVPVTPFTKIWSYDFGTIPGATDDQYPFPNSQGTHYIRSQGDLYSHGSQFIAVNSFVDFPVNNVNGGLQYECLNEAGGGPLGTAWPNCHTDTGVATFNCNFHGGRTAASFTFGWNGLPNNAPDSGFNPAFGTGTTPHSVVFGPSN